MIGFDNIVFLQASLPLSNQTTVSPFQTNFSGQFSGRPYVMSPNTRPQRLGSQNLDSERRLDSARRASQSLDLGPRGSIPFAGLGKGMQPAQGLNLKAEELELKRDKALQALPPVGDWLDEALLERKRSSVAAKESVALDRSLAGAHTPPHPTPHPLQPPPPSLLPSRAHTFHLGRS